MDSTAIIEISDNSAVQSLNHILDTREANAFVVPNGYTLQDFEKYNTLRRNYRCVFNTKSIAEFAEYVNEHKDHETRVLIDTDSMAATAVFDLGGVQTPGHGLHRAVVKLTPTVEFDLVKRLVASEATSITQQSFAEWLEDWRYTLIVTEVEGSEPLEIKRVITAVRNMTVAKKSESGSNIQSLSAEKTAMEKISVNATDALPGYVMIRAIPFNDFSQSLFAFRVSVLTGEKPAFKLRPIGYAKEIERIANEFSALIKERVKDCTVRIGTVTY